MVLKEGGSGDPSFRKVVVERGKIPCGVGNKVPQSSASSSTSHQHGEDRQEEKGQVGEEDNANQGKGTNPSQPMGMGGNNACKPKTTVIPNFF